VRGDTAERELVDQLFRSKHFDIVINFAAESHVDRSIANPEPFIETNVKGTQVLLEAARTYWSNSKNICQKTFLQISTDEVYGSIEAGKFTETSPLKPTSPYASSKAAADLLCRSYYQTYGLPVIITRSSNNYGPRQHSEKLIPLMIRQALQGEPLPVYGDGTHVREWLYVNDHCRALDLVLEKGESGEVFNIGSGEERTNTQVVQLICMLLIQRIGTEKSMNIQSVPDRLGHDQRYALDCSKIQELGFQPTQHFETNLNDTIGWYLQNTDWALQTDHAKPQDDFEYVITL